MILEFFRFELREQLRSPLLWVMAVAFALIGFGAAASESIQLGGSVGNVWRNSPAVIATWLGLFTFLGMLFVTMLVSGALLRDFEQGTAELVFASPVKKRDYLIGRIAAAFVTGLMVYVVIAIGLFVAQFMPWVEPERLGPVTIKPYLWAFAVLVVPNLLFTAALLSLLAVITRSILWVYIGVIAFFVLYGVSAALMRDVDTMWLAALSEPLGIRAMGRALRYWSAEERNTRLPELTGYLLANRALWLGVAAALFAATFALFRTERSGTRRRVFGKRARALDIASPAPRAAVAAVRASPRFGRATARQQFLRQLRFDAAGVFRSVPFLVLLAFALANFIPTALMSEARYGTGIYPVSSQMMAALRGSYSFLLIIIVLFYAGELVWKERAARIHEVTDAMPVPNWVPLLAKFCTLVVVIATFQGVGVLAAMAIQAATDVALIEPLVYLKLVAVDSVVYVLMGGLALVLQVFANNKFLGYGLLVLVMIGQGALEMLDFGNSLYNFGSWPNAPYSDMNGYGHFLTEQLAFQAYWALFLLAALLLAAAWWVRGVGLARRQRSRIARERLRGAPGRALAASVAAFAALGAFLFWNTNVRNTFRSPEDTLDLQARYERTYSRYANLPQPKIIAASIDVDIRPESQSMTTDGRYRLRNPHRTAIRDIHISLQDDRNLSALDIGAAKLVRNDADLGYRIYRLERPMAPGETRDMTFRVSLRPNGFTGQPPDTRIVENGTFFNNQVFPSFGYQERFAITDRNERRERGLGEPQRMAKLEDVAARAQPYIGDDADWIDFRTTVCTAPDQRALAPGYLQREYTRNGRRCFAYAMDRPMLNFYAYLSARWSVKRGDYNGIPIEIYFDPRHAYNVDRMIEATQKSLAYFEANLSPYQHKQVRIVEFPGYESFAQSFANTIPYSESIGFIADLRDRDNVDYVFYVTAHEVAHQWWAHQVIGANAQGATVLSESLAQYSALMVMEQEYGRDGMRGFLKSELDQYLGGRGGEAVDEMPLFRVENQQYIHYQKGSLVFYRLRDELGEAAVNRALRRVLASHSFRASPYPTSLDLIAALRGEARPDQQQMITDLFEKIAFYDNRVTLASAVKRPDGRYAVTLALHADKRYADGRGRETVAKVDDWMDVGVFARADGGKEANEAVLYMKRHRFTEKNPTMRLVVAGKPYEAGIDPYNKLIDRVSGDNRKKVELR